MTLSTSLTPAKVCSLPLHCTKILISPNGEAIGKWQLWRSLRERELLPEEPHRVVYKVLLGFHLLIIQKYLRSWHGSILPSFVFFFEAVISVISNMLQEIEDSQFHFIPQFGKSKDKEDVDLMLKQDQVLQRQNYFPPQMFQKFLLKKPSSLFLCFRTQEVCGAKAFPPYSHNFHLARNQSTTEEVEA